MTNEEFSNYFKNKTKAFAVAVIKYLDQLKDSSTLRIIKYQLIKSATSTAANYRAACRARSIAEFHSKISISLEEADESLFWLEMIEDTGLDKLKDSSLKYLMKEAIEIVSVLAKARKNTKK